MSSVYVTSLFDWLFYVLFSSVEQNYRMGMKEGDVFLDLNISSHSFSKTIEGNDNER